LLGFSIGLPCFPTGNSFTNWNKITWDKKAFVEKILKSDVHICTMRVSKISSEWEKWKMVPWKSRTKQPKKWDQQWIYNCIWYWLQNTSQPQRTGQICLRETSVIHLIPRKILDWCNSNMTKRAC
jgi:hypothetical protein